MNVVCVCTCIEIMWQFPGNVDSTPMLFFFFHSQNWQQLRFFFQFSTSFYFVYWLEDSIEILMSIWIIGCNGFQLLRDSRILAWLALLSLLVCAGCTIYKCMHATKNASFFFLQSKLFCLVISCSKSLVACQNQLILSW